ncbi:hypothetical protein GCM10007981_13570 [Thermocladium modestius]|uniref:Dinitrogenase iron-molybdenum cofactor biosynthesis domain-containing protein n=1 Tax=Thermocladium modestius TaxID=62609 RepID=A0A830GX70_9CREN|nr:NifB/NifX family molybdenum-iron cluster-binding protein [Thermocladium modestius]GGP21500.1 hypothetical protein GCM10007981_13570 [Thermocladium modestius]
MVRIALATDDEKTISKGHFAHAREYIIYDLNEETGELVRVESRSNPLGTVPDMDEGIHAKASAVQPGIPMHGLPKYEWLRNNVLSDVNAVIASGACQTSYNYFTSEGVQILFVEPNTSIDYLLTQITLAADEEEEEDEDEDRGAAWGTDKD